MKSFDEELRSSLRRKEPSPDLVRRVLSQIDVPGARKTPWWEWVASNLWAPRFRWAAATAALACMLIAAGVIQNRRAERERVEGEMARARVLMALRIASAKLNVAFKQVERVDGVQPRERPREKHSGQAERL